MNTVFFLLLLQTVVQAVIATAVVFEEKNDLSNSIFELLNGSNLADSSLSKSDFGAFCRVYNDDLHFSDSDVSELFEKMDTDGSGMVDRTELSEFWHNLAYSVRKLEGDRQRLLKRDLIQTFNAVGTLLLTSFDNLKAPVLFTWTTLTDGLTVIAKFERLLSVATKLIGVYAERERKRFKIMGIEMWNRDSPLEPCALNYYLSDYPNLCSHGGYQSLDDRFHTRLSKLFHKTPPQRHRNIFTGEKSMLCVIPNFPTNDGQNNGSWKYCERDGNRYIMNASLNYQGYARDRVPAKVRADEYALHRCLDSSSYCRAVVYDASSAAFSRESSEPLAHQGSIRLVSRLHYRGDALQALVYANSSLLIIPGRSDKQNRPRY